MKKDWDDCIVAIDDKEGNRRVNSRNKKTKTIITV